MDGLHPVYHPAVAFNVNTDLETVASKTCRDPTFKNAGETYWHEPQPLEKERMSAAQQQVQPGSLDRPPRHAGLATFEAAGESRLEAGRRLADESAAEGEQRWGEALT